VTRPPDHLDVTRSPPLAPGAPDDGRATAGTNRRRSGLVSLRQGRGARSTMRSKFWVFVFASIAAFGVAAIISVIVHWMSAV
jgi:hypothetical protein